MTPEGLRVGPAGWSYKDWEGIVYPRTKPKDFHPLTVIASLFDVVEVNSTFYADPNPAYAERWESLVASQPKFVFTAKLHGDFTHAGQPTRAAWDARERAFRDGLAPLLQANRLAAVLAQFPVSFRRGAREEKRVVAIAERFNDLGVVFELRHRSWFEPTALSKFEQLGASVAHLDLPAARDHLPADHAPLGPTGYLRLHGRNASAWFDKEASRDERYDYMYTGAELDPIVTRARRLAGEHDQVFVVTNNHFEGQAVANGLELQAALGHRPGPIPEGLFARFPHLTSLFEGPAADRLF